MLPAILIITFAVYAPTLNAWFLEDDFWLLRSSQTTPLGKFIFQAFDYRDLRPVPQFVFYRPLYIISFRLWYAMFGQHALAYHTLNVALHLGSVALVWVIAKRLLESGFAANMAAAIFALHPAYTESVVWVARGNTGMVTFVYLLTLLAFLKYVDGGSHRQLYYAASVVGFAAAILYHTTALSLAAVLPAYVFLMVRRPSDALRPRLWLPFAPFVAIAIAMAVIQTRPEVALQRGFRMGFHQYSNLGQYLGWALFPVFTNDWLDLHLPRVTLVPRLQMAASLAMIGGALVLLDRREWPYRGVFIVWWSYVTLIPNTTAVLGPAAAQLYLPGACVGLFFVLVGRRLIDILPATSLRLVSRLAPLALTALLVSSVGLGLRHEWLGISVSHDNQTFVARVREAVPPLASGSTLYVIQPPWNLIIFNDDSLDAALELYYGDLNVRHISPGQAAWIRIADPTAVIFDNRPSSQP